MARSYHIIYICIFCMDLISTLPYKSCYVCPSGFFHSSPVACDYQEFECNECHLTISVFFSFVQFNLDSNIWSRAIWIPAHREIPYRYLISSLEPLTENVHVRRWETHLIPRRISADQDDRPPNDHAGAIIDTSTPTDTDTFGDINGEEKIDRGWLTTETAYQFKFIHNPFTLKLKLKNRLLYVKVRL